jgi:hypothetical protein
MPSVRVGQIIARCIIAKDYSSAFAFSLPLIVFLIIVYHLSEFILKVLIAYGYYKILH